MGSRVNRDDTDARMYCTCNSTQFRQNRLNNRLFYYYFVISIYHQSHHAKKHCTPQGRLQNIYLGSIKREFETHRERSYSKKNTWKAVYVWWWYIRSLQVGVRHLIMFGFSHSWAQPFYKQTKSASSIASHWHFNCISLWNFISSLLGQKLGV